MNREDIIRMAQPEQRNLTEQEHDVLMNSIKASSTVVSKGFLAQPQQEQKCWCTTCHPITMSDMRFVVCPDCGNKRCPKANDHRHACTGSNEVGQKGSSWEHVKPMAYPEQEPVAITITGKLGNIYSFTSDYSLKKGDKVYTTPPQRKPLSWERVLEIGLECANDHSRLPYEVKIARAIEQAHGIKGEA